MDPIKAATLTKQVDELQAAFDNCASEFGSVWAMIEELHLRTLYIMEKVTLVHRETVTIVGAPPKETRMSLTVLFAKEREHFLARIADVQSKLDAFKSGAHLAQNDGDLADAAASAVAETGTRQGPRDGAGQLVRL